MRCLVAALLMSVASPALAQAPAAPAAPQMQLDIRFVVQDTDTQRFIDRDDLKGVPLVARDAVQVVAEHEGMVRVFVKGGFGWVAPELLSKEPPALPEPEPGALPPLLPPG